MEITLLLEFEDRKQLRDWLQENHASTRECWVIMSRAKNPVGVLPYLDVVEEALCFGWIDSTLKKLPDGRLDRTQQAEVLYPSQLGEAYNRCIKHTFEKVLTIRCHI